MSSRSSRRRWAGLSLASVAAVAVHLWLQAGMLLTLPSWRLESFRNYYPNDQLSYYAIAVEVSQGGMGTREPFTETGTIFYPRLYYVVLGLLARLFGVSVLSLWTLCGLAAQAVLIVVLGLTCAALTRRAWTALLAPLPFVVGTLATGDAWMTQLDSHAVLWGPFAELFTLNGATVALCLAGAACCALLVVARGATRALLLALPASCALGLLANIQTYVFITGVFVVGFSAGLLGLLLAGRRSAAGLSAGLLLLALVGGPPLADVSSPLLVFGLGLLAAAPGLWLLLRRVGRPGWVCLAGTALCAAPQILITLLGVHDKDPFLLYRQASTQDLGVPLGTGLVAALPVSLVLLAVLVAGVRTRRHVWTAASAGVLLAWALLSSNDQWGPSQEPYRLWLAGLVLAAIVALPLGTWVVAELWTSVPKRRLAVAGLTALVVLPAVVSTADFVAFRSDVAERGVVRFDQPELAALQRVLEARGDHLVLVDPCIDPILTKAVDGGPVAFYSLGLAWPDHEPEYQQVLKARRGQALDAASARAAGIDRIVTESSCAAGWPERYASELSPLIAVAYTDHRGRPAQYQLWALRP